MNSEFFVGDIPVDQVISTGSVVYCFSTDFKAKAELTYWA